MHLIDVLLLVWIAASLFAGYRKGFILQFVSLVSVIVAFIIAYQMYPKVAVMMMPYFHFREVHEVFSLPIPIDISVNKMVASAAAFGLLFIGSRIGLNLIARTLNVVASLPLINSANRIAGTMLSFAETLLILVLVVNIASVLPNEALQNIINQSQICQYTLTEFGFVREKMVRLLSEAII